MSFSAKVFMVMIASPSDVVEERDIIRRILHEWNDLHSKETEAVLLPVGWETHSAPDLSGRAQDIINQNVLSPCDLLIGVFWTRLGTPTGDFRSGSEEEIKRHVKEGKPAMVYFSEKPVAPQMFDADQFNELKKFRDWCRENGLISSYQNSDEFSRNLYRELQIIARDKLAIRRSRNLDFDSPTPSSSNTNEIVEYKLTQEARAILTEAAKDTQGVIMHLRTLSGTNIVSNGVSFIDANDRRTVAKWERGLEELREQGLIIDRGKKGEVFQISALGFQRIDQLQDGQS